MTVEEAAAQGLTKIRRSIWASPLDHLAIGPVWHRLYSPMNQAINGQDPVPLFAAREQTDDWEPYTGPAHDSEEYQAKAKEWMDREGQRNQFGHPQPCGCFDCRGECAIPPGISVENLDPVAGGWRVVVYVPEPERSPNPHFVVGRNYHIFVPDKVISRFKDLYSQIQ